MLNGSDNLGLVDMELSSRTQQSRMSKVNCRMAWANDSQSVLDE